MRLTLPGKRTLNVIQLEVYSVVAKCHTVCYDGKRDPNQQVCHAIKPNKIDPWVLQACAKCSGPGPTQCTSCAVEHAFVPWRLESKRGRKQLEGSCSTFKVTMQSAGMPGPMLVQYKDYSFYAKWGRAESVNEISIPAAEGTVATGKPVCNQYKMIWCRHERNKVLGEGSAQKKEAKCWVKKHTSLHMMNQVNIADWAGDCKTIPGAHRGGAWNDFCYKIKASYFNGTSLKNVNDVCKTSLVLL